MAESIEPERQTLHQNILMSVYDSNGFEGLINTHGQMIFPYSQHGYQVETIQPDIMRVISWIDGMERCALYNCIENIQTDFTNSKA